MSNDNKIKVQRVTVTPKLAMAWLKKNHPENRKPSQPRVQAMANDIKSGNWHETHQPICFGNGGYLIDGQHRLSAVVLANKSVSMLVAHNPKGELSDPIDRAMPRNLTFLTGIHARTVAALAVVSKLEQGQLYAAMAFTPDQAREVYMRYEADITAIQEACAQTHKLVGGVLAAALWTMPIDRARTIDFVAKVLTGEMIKRGHPAYTFRSWYERNGKVGAINVTLAALAALRQHIHGVEDFTSLYVGPFSYQASCGRRRAMHVPHTPTADIVPSKHWGNGMLKEEQAMATALKTAAA